MAVYEFEIGKTGVLKVDFVKDVADLIHPRGTNGIASTDDIYYRKILAATLSEKNVKFFPKSAPRIGASVGWTKGESRVGGVLAGGRQKTKDLFDIFYLSNKVESLSDWFSKYFDRSAYETQKLVLGSQYPI